MLLRRYLSRSDNSCFSFQQLFGDYQKPILSNFFQHEGDSPTTALSCLPFSATSLYVGFSCFWFLYSCLYFGYFPSLDLVDFDHSWPH